jgi:hypothetical protein
MLAFHRGGPGSIPGSGQVGFVVDKVALGQVRHHLLKGTFSLARGTRERTEVWPEFTRFFMFHPLSV